MGSVVYTHPGTTLFNLVMGKSVRAHTVRLHKRIKKEKLQKTELRRAEAIAARAAEALAKYNAGLQGTFHYPSIHFRVLDSTLPASFGSLNDRNFTDASLFREFC